jgi:tripartite-type tricarboxylate transporter receptor subunit TctC
LDSSDVTYKGGGPAEIALQGGEVQLMFTITAMGSIRSGKLRALAVTGAKPSALFPDLPTVSETLPGYVLENIAMVTAPTKTPEVIIRRLNQEIVRFLNRPEIRKRFLDFGTEVVASSPEQSAAYRDADMTKISKIIKDSGIPVE